MCRFRTYLGFFSSPPLLYTLVINTARSLSIRMPLGSPSPASRGYTYLPQGWMTHYKVLLVGATQDRHATCLGRVLTPSPLLLPSHWHQSRKVLDSPTCVFIFILQVNKATCIWLFFLTSSEKTTYTSGSFVFLCNSYLSFFFNLHFLLCECTKIWSFLQYTYTCMYNFVAIAKSLQKGCGVRVPRTTRKIPFLSMASSVQCTVVYLILSV